MAKPVCASPLTKPGRFFPGDCVNISWRADGIESLYVEGRGEIGQGEKTFCPQINAKAAKFEVRTPDGLQREFMLRVHFLPDLLVYLTGIVGTLGSLGMAAYFLLTKRMDKAVNPRWLLVCLSALVVIGVFLRLSEPEPPRLYVDDGQVKVAMWADKSSLAVPRECVDVGLSVVGAQSVRHAGEVLALRDNAAQVLHCEHPGYAAMLEVTGLDGVERQYDLPLRVLWGSLAYAPVFFYINLVALVLAALVYLPMAINKARETWLRREWSDFAAIFGLTAAVLIVYLPFGFESVGQWEEWVNKAVFENAESEAFRGEYASRPFVDMPRTLATRYSTGTGSVLWLMLACYCALDFLDSNRWRSLAGCALALLFYLAVSLKAFWVLWLYATGRPVFASRTINALFSADASSQSSLFDGFTDGLASIYYQIYFGGWRTAFESLAVNELVAANIDSSVLPVRRCILPVEAA